jgi:hypothetical protein
MVESMQELENIDDERVANPIEYLQIRRRGPPGGPVDGVTDLIGSGWVLGAVRRDGVPWLAPSSPVSFLRLTLPQAHEHVGCLRDPIL